MNDSALHRLDGRLDSMRSKLDAQIRELADVIVNDIPTFAQKNVRKSFIESVDRVESKSDGEIAELKQKLRDFSASLTEKYRAALLAGMDIWRGSDVALDAGKTLDGNAAVSAILSQIATDVAEFIEAADLCPIDIVYKTPAYFINGKYAPGMIEKYWMGLAALRALEKEREQAECEAKKVRVAQRWDEN